MSLYHFVTDTLQVGLIHGKKVLSAMRIWQSSTSVKSRNAVPVNSPWMGGFENAKSFPLTSLRTLEGQVPEGIDGTSFRNGPGIRKYGDQELPNLIDPSGAILKVDFSEGKVSAALDFIQTEQHQHAQEHKRFLKPIFGYIPEGTIFQRGGWRLQNPANIHVISLPEREEMLALNEGGKPYSIKPSSLETVAENNFGNKLKSDQTFCSHPKTDADGRTFGFGVLPGLKTKFLVYELSAKGEDTVGKLRK